MKNKILFINACTRHNSRTYELAKHLLTCIEGEITQLDLYQTTMMPVDSEALENRMQNIDNCNFSCAEFEQAKEFASADTIVIAAPFWDLSFPAVLKVYFENITVSGITFEYSDKGCPVGKCNADKLYYVTTSGGYIGKNNFGFDYVKALSEKIFDIPNIFFYSAEGLDIFGANTEVIMNETKGKITNDLK